MEEDLKMVDAIADGAWGAATFPQGSGVSEEMVAGDIDDADAFGGYLGKELPIVNVLR